MFVRTFQTTIRVTRISSPRVRRRALPSRRSRQIQYVGERKTPKASSLSSTDRVFGDSAPTTDSSGDFRILNHLTNVPSRRPRARGALRGARERARLHAPPRHVLGGGLAVHVRAARRGRRRGPNGAPVGKWCARVRRGSLGASRRSRRAARAPWRRRAERRRRRAERVERTEREPRTETSRGFFATHTWQLKLLLRNRLKIIENPIKSHKSYKVL